MSFARWAWFQRFSIFAVCPGSRAGFLRIPLKTMKTIELREDDEDHEDDEDDEDDRARIVSIALSSSQALSSSLPYRLH